MHNKDIIITFISLSATPSITKMAPLTMLGPHTVINKETWETNEQL